MSIKIIYDNKTEQMVFDGKEYLCKDRRYAQQYLGKGETEEKARINMQETIKRLNLQKKEIF